MERELERDFPGGIKLPLLLEGVAGFRQFWKSRNSTGRARGKSVRLL
jgi:hypothetical protein